MEVVVVVASRDAFLARYGALYPDVRIAGECTNQLENDGETIIVSAADGSAIRNFTYNDVAPWPEAADGDGMTLMLIDPFSNPDHNDPLSWRSSVTPGGVPGGSDGTRFDGDPDGDDDRNGIPNLLQYAIAPAGVEPVLPEVAFAQLSVDGLMDDYLTLTFHRNQAADDAAAFPEISEDLVTWVGEGASGLVFVTRIENGDGTERLVYRMAEPYAGQTRLFGRIRVESGTP